MRMLKRVLILTLIILPAIGQGQGQEKSVFDESLMDFYIVAGTAVGGAVLGLSTLSFVEEPSDHLKNIVVGGAIGTIVGVGIVAYTQATKSRESFYQNNPSGFMTPPVSPVKSLVLDPNQIFEKKPIWLAWKWQF